MDKTERLEIRAHHGMCLSFFEGKGYNDSFTGHMEAVKQALRHNPLIRLTTGTDVICGGCPNNQDGICCETADKVSGYDRQVLELCGLAADDELEWRQFERLVYERILNVDKRREICHDCEWDVVCRGGDTQTVPYPRGRSAGLSLASPATPSPNKNANL